jgi:aspartyl-tRNA(Asn)/glutamyl-tRNA(Gln) amidotransferase subunit A
LLYSAICGPDPFDATSLPGQPPDPFETLEAGPEGLRVGVLADLEGGGVERAVAEAFAATVSQLEGAGASIREVKLPSAAAGLSAYYLIAPAECSSNLARYDGVRYGLRVEADSTEEMHARTRAAGFGPEVKRRIMLGTYALSAGYYEAYYATAQKARTLIRNEFAAAYEDVDVIVSPTAPGTAFPIAAKLDDPLAMYLNDLFTIPANLVGAPGISVPVGLDESGLPIGFQVQAPPLGEAAMFRAARAVEALAGFAARPAELAA